MANFKNSTWIVLILTVLRGKFVKCSVPEEKPMVNTSEADVTNFLDFPEDFVVGAATSAYQIEGAWNVSGRGVSIWDHYIHVNSSRVSDNSNADVACDSYNHWKEDVALLKKLGFKAYRFSVSWTRVLPTGFLNEINQAGLDYYHGLVDELLANGIEPIVTISHYDHPQSIEDLGGWTNETMRFWFTDYARVLFRELGPKVKKWITVNEPEMFCEYGYSTGEHAPGKKILGIGGYLCVHNVLKTHATVYRMYQNEFKKTQNGKVGITIQMMHYYPKDPARDQLAVDHAFNETTGWMIHPIFSKTGDYHEVLKNVVGNVSKAQGYPVSLLPTFSQEWIDFIRGSADFLGINHYTSFLAGLGTHGPEQQFVRDPGVVLSHDPSWKHGGFSWSYIVPSGLGDLLRKVAKHYDNPEIYVTENGLSDYGGTNDTQRIQYFNDYFREVLIAVNRDGVNVKGYIAWSLLDNFEWGEGYKMRFGLVQVDFNDPSRKRTLKDSARWWQRVLERRSLKPLSVDIPLREELQG